MTPLQKCQSDHLRCLELAGELLGGPARAADLDWELERLVRRSARRETRRGIDAEHDIDPAFRRPGRIDLVLGFPKPGALSRRRLIEECWHPEIAINLRLDEVVTSTDGLSFA